MRLVSSVTREQNVQFRLSFSSFFISNSSTILSMNKKRFLISRPSFSRSVISSLRYCNSRCSLSSNDIRNHAAIDNRIKRRALHAAVYNQTVLKCYLYSSIQRRLLCIVLLSRRCDIMTYSICNCQQTTSNTAAALPTGSPSAIEILVDVLCVSVIVGVDCCCQVRHERWANNDRLTTNND